MQSPGLGNLGPFGRISVGQSLQLDGTAHTVDGWIAYDGEWAEYLLDDGRWFCVETDDNDALKFSVWTDQDGEPPAELTADKPVAGVVYREIERYNASFRSCDGQGDITSGKVKVIDLESDGPDLAAVEDWGDCPEWSLGERVDSSRVRLP